MLTLEDINSMFFDPEITHQFAELEQNSTHQQVADIVDRVIMQLMQFAEGQRWEVAELGGGAHCDRYERLFGHLCRYGGQMYWVDFSPYMIDMAARYLQMPQCAMRRKVIMFVLSDMLSFLRKQNQEMLDLVIMKYTLNFLPDIEPLIELVSQKLKPGGVMVATISTPDGVLKSRSTHARYVYRGHEFSPNEERHLEDGDEYGIKFFVNPNDPAEGYLAETTAFYHSCDKLKRAARRFGLGCFVGDWKEVVGDAKENKNVTVLVLKKRDE